MRKQKSFSKKILQYSIYLYRRFILPLKDLDLPNTKWKLSVLSALPFWVASFLVGLISVLYASLFGWAEEIYFWLLETVSYWMFPISAAFFIGGWYIVHRFSPYASGSGIPQVVASLELIQHKRSSRIIQLLSFPIILVKIASSMLMALGGAVIGREGPTIQIAGAVFKKTYDFLPKWWPRISPKNMIMTGAAAGLAAAFNTPLGGLVFAIEELTKTHISNFKNSIFIGVVIAGITAQSIVGSYLYLGYPVAVNISYAMVFAVILSSLFTGGFAGLYTKLTIKLMEWRQTLNIKKRVLFLVFGSAFITAMALYFDHKIACGGHELIITSLFSQNKYSEWYVPFGKFIGSSISFVSGAAGGVFAPALSVGASISGFFSGVLELSGDNTNLLVMTGMVAFLTGITRSPFTSAILVLEMTDRHNLIFFFMLAAVMGNIAARSLHRKPLYEYIKESILRNIKK